MSTSMIWVASLLLAQSAPAIARDERDKDIKQRIEAFDRIYDAKDEALPAVREYEILNAMKAFEGIDHPLLAKRLAKLSRDKRELIRSAAVAHLGDQASSPREAGRAVLAIFEGELETNRTLLSAARAAGKLKLKDAIEPLGKLLQSADDEVCMAALRAFGEIGSPAALKILDDFFEVNSLDPNQAISVRVDSGAAGNRDARAAAAKGKALQAQRRRKRDETLALTKEVLKKLTGEKIETPLELRDWMSKNRDKVRNG